MNSEGTLKTRMPMETNFQHVKEQIPLPLLY